MQVINRDQLVSELSSQPLYLIEVLPAESFEKGHLPRAINVPLGDEFQRKIRGVVSSKDARVVVYCQDEDCHASEKAAKALEDMGYTNVADYAAGKQDWQSAGFPMR